MITSTAGKNRSGGQSSERRTADMKNQMMNLFASYSFYYFPGYYYGADCFCCKKQTSPIEGQRA
jgi:hypothetical protein